MGIAQGAVSETLGKPASLVTRPGGPAEDHPWRTDRKNLTPALRAEAFQLVRQPRIALRFILGYLRHSLRERCECAGLIGHDRSGRVGDGRFSIFLG